MTCTRLHPASVAASIVAAALAAPALADVGYDGRFGDTAVRYADTMIERGRDTYGSGTMASGDSKQSGLFLSAMDRKAAGGPVPLAGMPFFDTSFELYGVRTGDRVYDRLADPAERRLVGANPMHDQQLYQLLYEVGDRTGQARYAQAADAALQWFVRNTRSGLNGDVRQGTDLLAWGEHLSWDPFQNKVVGAAAGRPLTHEFYQNWELWDRLHSLDASGTNAFATNLWLKGVIDQDDATFSRHAPYDGVFSEPSDKLFDFPRHAGYFIETWAHALKDPAITGSDATLELAVDRMLKRYEDKRAAAAVESGMTPGLIPFTISTRNNSGIPENKLSSLFSNLELSIQAHNAADLLDGKADANLVRRLYDFGATEDEVFFLFDHDPDGAGLVTGVDIRNRQVRGRNKDIWGQAYGGAPLAGTATLMIDRFDQLAAGTADQQATAGLYRSLILEIGDIYQSSDPDGTVRGEGPDGDYFDEPIWPQEIADAIMLQLFAFEQTDEQQYLDAAVRFGDLGRDVFFGSYALSRAAGNAGHYESITGGDDLALALYRLDAVLVPEPTAALSLVGLGSLALGRRR